MKALVLRQTEDSDLPIPGADPWHVRPTDPAVTVMTDFRVTASITVVEAAGIDAALEHMRHTGVRCAFAIDPSRNVVVGLITAYDILGEQPIRHMQAASMQRRDVLVWHVMHRVADWAFLLLEDLEQATVGNLAALFDASGLTHIPVMTADSNGSRRLRGLLSAAKIRRLLAAKPAAYAT